MPRESDQDSVIWPQDMQDDPTSATVGDEDFSKFLDLEPNFQFPALDNGQSGLDTPMGRLGFGQPQQTTMHTLNFQQQQQLMDMELSLSNNQLGFHQQIPTTQNFEPFQQYHHMQTGHHYHVPPTPISSEMHASKYNMDNAGQIMFDRHQASFTPLVSPAQTPLTGGFGLPEYGNADDFFSPLTSPAIEAQIAQNAPGATASSIGMVDTATKSTSASRRGRTKGVSTRAQTRSVKQSPATKPITRRKGASSSSIRNEKGDTAAQPKQNPQLTTPLSLARASDDSVSPEALSEALMGPPPVPQGADKSPMAALLQSSDSTNAVTPATLMMIPRKEGTSPSSTELQQQSLGDDEPLEDIALPDAAALSTRPSRLQIDVNRVSEDDQSTPTLSAKSAKLSATSTPRSAFAKPAPQDSFSKSSKSDGRAAGRGNKKRQSTSSAAISPALRPKISPSITPLAPASAPGMPHLSAETSALYLASKSNYQNIIDGTHLPGVSYPEALAENLSSKRTSHKIAEQGRRNRINVALKEIEALLPPAISGGGSKKEPSASTPEMEGGDKCTPSMQGASKASTVEMAIIYIRSLQAELKMTKNKLEMAEKKLADSHSSAGSQTSD